ncbi:hypothetical protein ABIA06_004054 [Bradyrhizobium yuanmingense]|uniref:Uncharacterized protein n=1 Tax=Bradyrhizobium yuanmingense TaxID=108015 RepID=A0A1C3V2N9_9BRAD|nr:hypothetical protein IQ15_04002 [Bradyrhizobium yuanmingense]SCB22011.1 hypothetical protein GA0061099_100384 [Bradyrhizobium yuanmingense]
MPGLVPGLHVLRASWLSVKGRDKPGHDAAEDFENPTKASHRFAADAQPPRVTTGQRG